MAEPTDNPTPERRASPPEANDPRLAIPEILRDKPAKPKEDPESKSVGGFGDTAKAWGMGLDLVFTTIGGFMLGWGFDYWRGTGPWGAIIGLALGFVLAMVRLVRYSIKADAKEQAERQRRHQFERSESDGENPPV
ncbi:MAG: AtpZ/AtpI family protein [Phycisphaerales bacterium JB061]